MKSQVEILNDSIALLQTKQKGDLSLLKAQINSTIEILKPSNLLNTARTEILKYVKEEGHIFNKMFLLATKKVSHKISASVSRNPIVKFLEGIF
jgi:hypothetical protein